MHTPILEEELGISRGSPLLSRQVAQCDQSREGKGYMGRTNEGARSAGSFLSQ